MGKIAIVYYSSTGHTFQMAKAIARGAESVGAEVRVRKTAEIAPQAAIDSRPGWREHLNATADVPEAETADLEWADGFLFGTPTRFGLPAAQLKQFLDQTGGGIHHVLFEVSDIDPVIQELAKSGVTVLQSGTGIRPGTRWVLLDTREMLGFYVELRHRPGESDGTSVPD